MHTVPQSEWWRALDMPAQPVPGSGVEPRQGAGHGLPFWALMCFTFILVLAPQSLLPVLAPLHIALACAVIAGAAYVLERFVHHQPVLVPSRALLIAGALAVWALLTTPVSYWPGGSLAFLLDVYLKSLVVFWLLASIVDTPPKLGIVAWALSLMAIPLALAAVETFFSGGFRTQELSHGLTRISGYDAPLSSNPNDLALTLDMILPLSMGLLLGTRRPGARLFLTGLICLDAIAVIATYSRAGFLTLGVVVLMYLVAFAKRRKLGLVILAAALVLACLPLLPAAYVERLSTITDIQSDTTGSAQARWQDTLAATSYVLGHPLVGAGIGMNILALNEVRGVTWKAVHNVYLEYGVELGLPGLLMFLALFWECLGSAHRARRLSADGGGGTGLTFLAEGIGVSLTAFIAAAFFYPDAYQFYFYYLAGLAVAAASIAARAAGTPVEETLGVPA